MILTAIINEHFVTGEPVGSKTLAEKFANASGLSSATIRSVMGELEELGLLEQPHTSAGRVPTDQGYRFYVDNLLGVLSISNDDLHRIGEEFGLNRASCETPDRLMERTSQLLSALSNNVGIVVSPSLANDRLQHIEFVNLSDNRILVVLVSAPNIVHNKIIRLNVTFAKEELERTANYLNAEFAGKSLAEIRAEILQPDARGKDAVRQIAANGRDPLLSEYRERGRSARRGFRRRHVEYPDEKRFCRSRTASRAACTRSAKSRG